jgi:hypothetical protein
MLRHQAGDVEPSATVTAIARHVEHEEAGGDLAEGDEAGGQGLSPFSDCPKGTFSGSVLSARSASSL